MSATLAARLLCIALALFCVISAFPVEASRVRPLNLEQLTESADRVFSGHVTDVRVEQDERIGRPVTRVTLDVQRSAKGQLAETVTIKLFGNQTATADPRRGMLGLPRFAVGEELVLFLYPASDLGLTSPIGLAQGKFAIYRDDKGGRAARNPYGNASLLDGLSPRALAAFEAGGRPLSGVDAGRIGPDELLDLVESIVASPVRARGDGAGKPGEAGR